MSAMEIFGSFTTEAADKEYARTSGPSWFKLQDGNNVLRFLPPMKGMSLPWVEVHQHFLKIPGSEKPIVFNCPRYMGNQECPACQKVDELLLTGNSEDVKVAKDYEASFRAFALVVDRKAPEKGIQPFGFGKSIRNRLLELRRNADLGVGDFTNFESGKDIIINKKGSGLNTQYSTDPGAQRPIAEHTDQLMEWLDNMPEDGLEGFSKTLPLTTIKQRLTEGGFFETPSSRPALSAASGDTPAW